MGRVGLGTEVGGWFKAESEMKQEQNQSRTAFLMICDSI